MEGDPPFLRAAHAARQLLNTESDIAVCETRGQFTLIEAQQAGTATRWIAKVFDGRYVGNVKYDFDSSRILKKGDMFTASIEKISTRGLRRETRIYFHLSNIRDISQSTIRISPASKSTYTSSLDNHATSLPSLLNTTEIPEIRSTRIPPAVQPQLTPSPKRGVDPKTSPKRDKSYGQVKSYLGYSPIKQVPPAVGPGQPPKPLSLPGSQDSEASPKHPKSIKLKHNPYQVPKYEPSGGRHSVSALQEPLPAAVNHTVPGARIVSVSTEVTIEENGGADRVSELSSEPKSSPRKVGSPSKRQRVEIETSPVRNVPKTSEPSKQSGTADPIDASAGKSSSHRASKMQQSLGVLSSILSDISRHYNVEAPRLVWSADHEQIHEHERESDVEWDDVVQTEPTRIEPAETSPHTSQSAARPESPLFVQETVTETNHASVPDSPVAVPQEDKQSFSDNEQSELLSTTSRSVSEETQSKSLELNDSEDFLASQKEPVLGKDVSNTLPEAQDEPMQKLNHISSQDSSSPTVNDDSIPYPNIKEDEISSPIRAPGANLRQYLPDSPSAKRKKPQPSLEQLEPAPPVQKSGLERLRAYTRAHASPPSLETAPKPPVQVEPEMPQAPQDQPQVEPAAVSPHESTQSSPQSSSQPAPSNEPKTTTTVLETLEDGSMAEVVFEGDSQAEGTEASRMEISDSVGLNEGLSEFVQGISMLPIAVSPKKQAWPSGPEAEASAVRMMIEILKGD